MQNTLNHHCVGSTHQEKDLDFYENSYNRINNPHELYRHETQKKKHFCSCDRLNVISGYFKHFLIFCTFFSSTTSHALFQTLQYLNFSKYYRRGWRTCVSDAYMEGWSYFLRAQTFEHLIAVNTRHSTNLLSPAIYLWVLWQEFNIPPTPVTTAITK